MLLTCAALAGGCDFLSKKAAEVKKAATDTTQQVVERVKQKTGDAGQIEVALAGGTPVKTAACYGELVVVGHGRPAVLQVKSSDTVEAFPSLLFQANTQAESPAALANQTLQGLVYLQLQPDGSIWHTADGETVSLSVQTVTDGQFTGTFSGGKLINTETNESRPIAGTLSGSLK
jgi:hypothetical protein